MGKEEPAEDWTERNYAWRNYLEHMILKSRLKQLNEGIAQHMWYERTEGNIVEQRVGTGE